MLCVTEVSILHVLHQSESPGCCDPGLSVVACVGLLFPTVQPLADEVYNHTGDDGKNE